MEPMMNAPKADEKPAKLAKTTIRKHKPTENTVNVSSDMNFLAQRNTVGTKKMPPMNHINRKKPSFNILETNCIPSKVLLTAKVDSMTISRTASRSSTTNSPMTLPLNFSRFNFMSSKALAIIVVEEMESMAPRKIQSICDQPKSLPNRKPTTHIVTNSVKAVMPTVPPTFFNFLKLNSKPMPNSMNTMPISLQVSTLVWSLMTGNHSKFGPMRKPAMM